MKRLLVLLLAAALMLAQTACAPAVTPAPADPGEGIPPQTEPVVLLKAPDLPEGMMIDRAVALGNGLVALNCARWDDNDDMPLRYDECTWLVDTLRDRTLGRTEGWQPVVGRRSNGEILAVDPQAEEIRYYDGSLTLLRTEPLPPEAFSSFYDRQRDRLCWLDGDAFSCLFLADGRIVTCPLEEGARAEAYDPQTGLLVYTVPSAGDVSPTDWVLYDPERREIKGVGASEDVFTFLFTGDTLAGCSYLAEEDENGEYADTSLILTVYDPAQSAPQRRWKCPEDVYLQGQHGSPCLVGAASLFGGDADGPQSTFLMIDVLTGRAARPVDMTGLLNPGVCRDPDTGRVYLYAEENGRGSLRVIEPALVAFDQQLESVSLPPAREPAALGAAFRELREQADALEAQYSVRILLGNEVKNASDPGDYGLVSAEGAEADPTGAIRETEAALETVRQVLAAYPKGFFERFRTDRGEGGLRILLVKELINRQFDRFDAAGITFSSGAWYNVALETAEVQEESCADVIHHELWHAVEDRITDLESGAFWFADWEALNPPGFEYSMDFDRYFEGNSLDEYLMYYGDDRDGVYFIGSYSTVTAKEDRATVVETLFSAGDIKEFYPGWDSYYQMVCSYPHLKAKLDEMAKWTEKVFGCVYWEEMLGV